MCIRDRLQLVCAAEVLRTVFWLLTRYAGMAGLASVSYTHLDVYKRQVQSIQ